VAWFALLAGRFTHFPGGGPGAIALASPAFLLAAWISVSAWGARHAVVRGSTLGLAAVMIVRMYLPLGTASPPSYALEAMDAVGLLRDVAAAQEQYRLLHGRYAEDDRALRPWLPATERTRLSLQAVAASGWRGSITVGTSPCEIWVRDTTLRRTRDAPEGVPRCGGDRSRVRKHSKVSTILDTATAGLIASPVRAPASGVWNQHRGDGSRSGILPAPDDEQPHRWATTVGGELRAPAAAAGPDVIVAAHGNGELVVMDLPTGQRRFRIRVPNWVHHEPAITDAMIVVGFGNNEHSGGHPEVLGSPPSGVAAYDRQTGMLRWRGATRGSVMSTPVVSDSVVAAVSSAEEVVAWRLSDGHPLWKTRLPGPSAMANPLLHGDTLIVTLERSQLCWLDIRTGTRIRCTHLDQALTGAITTWGAGHASAALSEGVLTATFLRRTSALDIGASALGLGEYFPKHEEEHMLVGLSSTTGKRLWSLSLGRGLSAHVSGHIAGTPTLEGNRGFVVSPVTGAIVAFNVQTGHPLWRVHFRPARGSPSVVADAVLMATQDTTFMVLEAGTGAMRCTQKLPGLSDRAGLTIRGSTGILTLRNGVVLARPLHDWLRCEA